MPNKCLTTLQTWYVMGRTDNLRVIFRKVLEKITFSSQSDIRPMYNYAMSIFKVYNVSTRRRIKNLDFPLTVKRTRLLDRKRSIWVSVLAIISQHLRLALNIAHEVKGNSV